MEQTVGDGGKVGLFVHRELVARFLGVFEILSVPAVVLALNTCMGNPEIIGVFSGEGYGTHAGGWRRQRPSTADIIALLNSGPCLLKWEEIRALLDCRAHAGPRAKVIKLAV